MRSKTGTETARGNTTHTHTHNKCMAGGHMTQMVVGEDVLSLLYQVSAGLHCVGLNFPVSSTDQHLEGGPWEGKQRVCKDTVQYTDTKLALFSGC